MAIVSAMLKQSFDQNSTDAKNGRVFVLLEEQRTRGRNHVNEGLGQLFAQRTGREYSLLTLSEIYKQDAIKNLNLTDQDVVFDSEYELNGQTGAAFHITSNEKYVDRLRGALTELTCHHLTSEILSQESKLFEEKYKDIRNPLIAVLIHGFQTDYVEFAKQIAGMAARYPQATIFLCGSWRTHKHDQLTMYSSLQKGITVKNLAGRINIENFALTKDADYNPYIGLIAKADHAIIVGKSSSMISEILFTGKTPILYDVHMPQRLKREDLVLDYYDVLDSKEFPTRPVAPINITPYVVDGMIEDFIKHGGIVPNWKCEKSEVPSALRSCSPEQS